jgi:hypothetical protein
LPFSSQSSYARFFISFSVGFAMMLPPPMALGPFRFGHSQMRNRPPRVYNERGRRPGARTTRPLTAQHSRHGSRTDG